MTSMILTLQVNENISVGNSGIRRTKNFIIKLLFYLVVFDLAFVFLYPFITVIADSLKTDNDIVNITVKWLPSQPEWNNYVVAWKRLRYVKYFKTAVLLTETEAFRNFWMLF